MAKPRQAPAVLVDACVLVKDVVSFVLYDLHAAGLLELYWTPETEAEYIEHRGRLRADHEGRATKTGDLIWASNRIDVIKQHLVKSSTPPGWTMEESLHELSGQTRFAPLQAMKDQDDIHVAIAAAHLADQLARAVVLVSDNLSDFPQDLLTPYKVVLMHPGTLLDLLHNIDAAAVADSLLKTAADFRNPPIPPGKMLWTIESRNQFRNPKLAEALAKRWHIPYTKAKGKTKD